MGFFKKDPTPLEPSWDTTSKYDNFWKTTGEFLLEIVKVVVISLAIIIPIRSFLIQPFYVKGASMEPTFEDHQYLIINEISYRFNEPARGDVIVFRYPKDPKQYFIKRIVGLPGERVVVRDGKVKIFNEDFKNGVEINESMYLDTTVTMGTKDMTLGEDEYFVLGDNRDASLDSRSFGVLPKRLIVGKVWIRGFPFSTFKIFTTPQYQL
ncbi:signal peptidase I [Candidatus Falkowbacteria bacterium]|nr:signal peptidase I [Candidatus Falkowbacteria bacterium]